MKTIELYHHKTDGGAEYLCSECVKGTDEGCLKSKYIVRIDGDIVDGELLIKEEDNSLIKKQTNKDFKEIIEKIRKELKDPKLNCWGVDKIIDKNIEGLN